MRFYITIAELLVLVAISIWLVTQPGSVIVHWGEYSTEDISLSVAFLGLAAAFLVVTLIMKAWHFILFLPTRMYAYAQKLRPEKGLKALTQSVITTALEEYEQGRSEAYRFERYLGDNPVHKGLLAFNNVQEGKLDEARKICETMKSQGDARTLSWIIEARIALQEGKFSNALAVLQSLYLIHDNSPWVIRQLLKSSLQLNLYDVSLEVLKKAERLELFSPQVIKQCRALIGFHQAEKETVNLEQKEELLEKAHRLAPDLVKISVQYSKVLRLLDKSKRAKKAIEQSWSVHPDNALLEEYLAIEHETDPKAIMKTASKLAGFNEHHAASYLAMARFALKMEEWGRARAALHDYQERHEMGQEACYLMARLELLQHADHTRYREWMERALNAGRVEARDVDIKTVLDI